MCENASDFHKLELNNKKCGTPSTITNQKNNKPQNSKSEFQCGMVYVKRDGNFSFLCTYRKSENLFTNENKFTESELKLCGYIFAENEYFKFVCKVCFQFFKYFAEFSYHMKDHSNIFEETDFESQDFNDKLCNKGIPSNLSKEDYNCNIQVGDSLKANILNDNKLQNNTLTKDCVNQKKIIRKKTKFCKQNIFRCEICNAQFLNHSNLLSHEREHSNSMVHITNRNDSLSFNYDKSKLNHEFKETFEEDQISYDITLHCDICHKEFCFESDLEEHKSIHFNIKPFQCEVCNKSFKKASDYTRHKRVHTGEKPYVCDFCGKKFATNSNLIEHRRTHTGEKKYKCDICEKAFTTSSNLSEHKRTHSGERPFSCEICGKTFISSSHLLSHKKNHLGLNNYNCTICNMVFKQSFSLKRHLKIHSGEKPHVCDICNKGFVSLYNLKEHRRTHTGEKPYKCCVCFKSFTHGSALSHHKKIHLNNNSKKSEINTETSLKTEVKIRENILEMW